MRDDGDPVVLVEGGDAFGSGSSFGDTGLAGRIKAETLIEGMSLMGYDAMGLGEREFMFGGSALRTIVEPGSFPITSANIMEATAVPFAVTEVLIQAGTVKIGVVSVLGQGLVPGNQFGDEHGGVVEVFEATDLLDEALARLAPEANFIVLLAHTGTDQATALAIHFNGRVDAVASSDGWDFRQSPAVFGGVPVASIGNQGKYLGRFDVFFDADGALLAVNGMTVVLDDSYADHPDQVALEEEYLARLEFAQDDLLAEIPDATPTTGSRYVGDEYCRLCHVVQNTQWLGTAHATAWDSLAELNQVFNLDCIGCHSTGFGYQGGFKLFSVTPEMADVQCESCHGAGYDHAMAPAPGYGITGEATCLGCHEPARFPDWDYAAAYPLVAH